ncbi:MAG: hypothetical protein NVS4B4_19210 [Bradyrhizobium sp.]
MHTRRLGGIGLGLALWTAAAIAQPLPTTSVTSQPQANANITYSIVAVGTTSTTVLVAAPSLRLALDLWNVSGRPTGTATDVWCMFGVPAVVGQGFPVFGAGGNVWRGLPSSIDGRALNCIAGTATSLTVGSVP